VPGSTKRVGQEDFKCEGGGKAITVGGIKGLGDAISLCNKKTVGKKRKSGNTKICVLVLIIWAQMGGILGNI